MTRVRRATALVLVGLAGPSGIWLLLRLLGTPSDSSSHGWGAELLFVVCCLVAAALGQRASLLATGHLQVASRYTYLITGPLVSGAIRGPRNLRRFRCKGSGSARAFWGSIWLFLESARVANCIASTVSLGGMAVRSPP